MIDKNTRIAYIQDDGSTAVINPTPDFCSRADSTIDELIERSVPKGAHFEILSVDEVPSDRGFRGAWCLNGGVSVDIVKARKIKMDELRIIRNKKLQDMDIDYQVASEQRDTAKQDEVAAKKQALRDMPSTTKLDDLELDALKDFTPDILK